MPTLDLFNHAEFSVIKETDALIFIKDTGGNSGSKTVTNDAPFVLKQLSEEYGIENRRVFYTDTEGRIDEIVHKDGCFAMFAPGEMVQISEPALWQALHGGANYAGIE